MIDPNFTGKVNNHTELLNNHATKLNQVNEQLAETTRQVNIHRYKHLVINDNWTNAINSAISELGSNGGIIKFNAQTYKTSQINLPSNIAIWGEGKEKTVLLYTFDETLSSDDRFITMGDRSVAGDGYNIRTVNNSFKDIKIKSNNPKTGTAIYACMTYTHWNDVVIDNFDVAFDVTNSWTNNFITLVVQNCKVVYRSDSQNNAISFVNCNFKGNEIIFDTSGCYSFTVIGGNIESTATSIIKIRKSGSLLAGFNMTGVYLENTCPFLDTLTDNFTVAINGVNLIGNNFVINGTGLVLNTGSNTSWEKSIFSGNTLFRNNSDSLEPFFHLEGTIRVDFGNNTGKTFPSKLSVPLTDIFTDTWNSGIIKESIEYPNIKRTNGSYKADKGIVLGSTINANGLQQGYLIYDSAKKSTKMYNSNSTSDWVYLQTSRNGSTASRPTLGSSDIGYQYYDTTLNKPIWWNGTAWKDSVGTTV